MKHSIKTLIASTLAIVVGGCSTTYRLVEERASQASLARFAQAGGNVTLIDGTVIAMAKPTVYGDVFCSTTACVQKSEIASTAQRQDLLSLNPDAALGLVSAPIILPAFAIMAAGLCDGECGSKSEQSPPANEPHYSILTWINGHGDVPTECAPHFGTMPASNTEAIDLIMQQRFQLSMECLEIIVHDLWGGKILDDRQRSLRLWALWRIRSEWIAANCEYTSGLKPKLKRISPAHSGYPRDLPPPFPLIQQTLAEDATYAIPGNLASNCGERMRPAEEAFDRATFVAIVNPFSRPDVHPRVLNDDPWP